MIKRILTLIAVSEVVTCGIARALGIQAIVERATILALEAQRAFTSATIKMTHWANSKIVSLLNGLT